MKDEIADAHAGDRLKYRRGEVIGTRATDTQMMNDEMALTRVQATD